MIKFLFLRENTCVKNSFRVYLQNKQREICMNKLTKEYIQTLLVRNDVVGMHAVGRALVHIRNRQTRVEQSSETTIEHNGVGFTGADAAFGTRLAGFYERNGYLSPKQVAVWQKLNRKGTSRIGKYWGQLLEEAKAKPQNPATTLPKTRDIDIEVDELVRQAQMNQHMDSEIETGFIAAEYR
jgi:hypothetical protein